MPRPSSTRVAMPAITSVALAFALSIPAFAQDAEAPLTVYSGRSESLVGPVLEQFTEATGIPVETKYGDTAELAALLLEEGEQSPADLFFAQDAGALGAVSDAGLFAPLPEDVLARVPAVFSDPARKSRCRWSRSGSTPATSRSAAG